MIIELALSAVLAGPVRDQPPECVPVTITSVQTGGQVRHLRFTFCGLGAGADSALRDEVAGRMLVLDGGGLPGRDCGTRRAPCVVFGP